MSCSDRVSTAIPSSVSPPCREDADTTVSLHDRPCACSKIRTRPVFPVRGAPMIAVRETGLVYRNPKPELRSRHTWHPTIVRFDDGELLCTFDIAEADVALDYRTYASRSSDAGKTWSEPVRVFADLPGRPATHSVRIARVSDGSVVAMGGLMYRDDPEAGLVNVPTLGYVDMDLVL